MSPCTSRESPTIPLKKLDSITGVYVGETPYLWQGAVNAAIRIPNTGTQQPQHGNDDQSNERKDDCILNKTLTFFLGCEEHGVVPSRRVLKWCSVTLLIYCQDRL